VPVKPPLTYRQRQAQATRERIAAAARSLFADRGYVTTTIEAIAEEAGVAVPTIYGAFGNKRAILNEIRRLWIEEAEVQSLIAEAMAEPNLGRRLELAAKSHRQQLERGWDVLAIHQQAALADHEMAEVFAKVLAGREREIRKFIKALEPGLKPGLDVQVALDMWIAVESEHVYRELVVNRGWTPARYEAWLANALKFHLLG
jgi:AcrR family transcriptional regulator